MYQHSYRKTIKLIFVFLLFSLHTLLSYTYVPVTALAAVEAAGQDKQQELREKDLYAKYAVLLDGDSGRVLFGKDCNTPAPMASTTKIMTCIIALQNAPTDLPCVTSAYAASMPDVQLNAKKGEVFVLSDLLHSLMLKSHNDSAVIIAENVAYFYIRQQIAAQTVADNPILTNKNLDFLDMENPSDTTLLTSLSKEQSRTLVAVFTSLMNEQAQRLGCTDTHFVTPNGLDGEDEAGIHHTTAKELAVIMAYCIKNETFLAITQTGSYSFSSRQLQTNGNLTNGTSYGVSNANAFLHMYDNIISGKTGFTGDAGYCYICAYRRDGRTFIVALLACGWPNNKTYKWHDARLLLNYGRAHYFYKEILTPEYPLKPITITDSLTTESPVCIRQSFGLLLSDNDTVNVVMDIPPEIPAPVNSGDSVGNVDVYVNDTLVFQTPAYAVRNATRTDFKYFLKFVMKSFCFIDK